MGGDTVHPHAQRVADPFRALWVPIFVISPPNFSISYFLVILIVRVLLQIYYVDLVLEKASNFQAELWDWKRGTSQEQSQNILWVLVDYYKYAKVEYDLILLDLPLSVER